MTRILALVASAVLIGYPAWLLKDITVPIPAYRKGGSADFLLFAQALLAVYGGVLLGIAMHWARANRSGHRLLPFGLFRAGIFGVLAVCIVFFVGGIVYGLMKYGAFDKAVGGNLWGLIVIFWLVLGAFVSAGLALLFYAWRGPAGHTGMMPGSGGSGAPHS
jgi:hypothetical protein